MDSVWQALWYWPGELLPGHRNARQDKQFCETANKPKDWQKRQRSLEELIRRVIVHTTCEPQQLTPVKSAFHRTILKTLKKDDSILTFNYDLLIEESFDSGDIWTPPVGMGTPHMGSEANGSKGGSKSEMRRRLGTPRFAC
jgi:hypothetical protein